MCVCVCVCVCACGNKLFGVGYYSLANNSGFSKCSLAKLKQTALYFFESRGFLLATLPWMPWLFNFRLTVDAFTFVPNPTREVCNSLEVMCGLAVTWFIIFLVLLGDSFDGRPLLGRGVVMLKALICKLFVLQWMDGAGIFWRWSYSPPQTDGPWISPLLSALLICLGPQWFDWFPLSSN